MRYRRSQVKGGSFFFTVVTFRRMRILMKTSNVDLLRESFKHVIHSHLMLLCYFRTICIAFGLYRKTTVIFQPGGG